MFFSDKSKNLLFYILVLIILLTFLGKPMAETIENYFIYLNNVIEDKIKEFVSISGYTIGKFLNSSSEIVSEASKDGVDIIDNSMEESTLKNITNKIAIFTNNGIEIANNSIHSLGNKLIHLNEDNLDINTKKSLNQSFPTLVSPDKTDSPIQTPIPDGEKGWCLLNKYENGNHCVKMEDYSKCMSGQFFPSQKKCMNST